MTTATSIIHQATRLGIELKAHGRQVRYRPVNRMTHELAGLIKVNKQAILAAIMGQAGIRDHVADLIQQARQAGRRDVARDLRFTWHERMAICTINGGLIKDHAEQIALAELEEYTLL